MAYLDDRLIVLSNFWVDDDVKLHASFVHDSL